MPAVGPTKTITHDKASSDCSRSAYELRSGWRPNAVRPPLDEALANPELARVAETVRRGRLPGGATDRAPRPGFERDRRPKDRARWPRVPKATLARPSHLATLELRCGDGALADGSAWVE
jgi:hypothetical protein